MLKEPCVGYENKMKELREKMCITTEELSLLTETELRIIEKLENGQLHPSDDFIERLANVFQMNPFEVKKYIWCEEDQNECITELR